MSENIDEYGLCLGCGRVAGGGAHECSGGHACEDYFVTAVMFGTPPETMEYTRRHINAVREARRATETPS